MRALFFPLAQVASLLPHLHAATSLSGARVTLQPLTSPSDAVLRLEGHPMRVAMAWQALNMLRSGGGGAPFPEQ